MISPYLFFVFYISTVSHRCILRNFHNSPYSAYRFKVALFLRYPYDTCNLHFQSETFFLEVLICQHRRRFNFLNLWKFRTFGLEVGGWNKYWLGFCSQKRWYRHIALDWKFLRRFQSLRVKTRTSIHKADRPVPAFLAKRAALYLMYTRTVAIFPS